MRARRRNPWPLFVSGALHLGSVLVAAWLRPKDGATPALVAALPVVDLDVADPPAPPPPPPPPPTAPQPAPPTPQPVAARAVSREALPTRNRAPDTAAPDTAAPEQTPQTTQPVAPQAVPNQQPNAAPLRAADILRASNDATLRGASEGWVLPPSAASTRGPRDIFGGGRGPCTTPECLRAIAMAPTTEGLAANPRDHRPAGAGRADRATARRAIESIDVVRSIPGIGRAVAQAPVHTVPGQRRTVGGGEGAVAEAFDQRMGSSFAGMTFGASTSDLRYRMLHVELEVEQEAAGGIRSIRVSRPSGFLPLDNAATRALREALGEGDWSAGAARWSRWRLEVSEAVTGTPFANNDDWVVYNEASDGTRVRVRMRLVAQRILGGGDAGA